MKKFFPIFLVLALFLMGCANLPDITSLLTTPTFTPADTATPPSSATPFPTRDLFAVSTATPVTFTPTETSLVPVESPTPIPTQTLVPLPTFSESFINDMSRITFSEQDFGFGPVLYSAPILYWDEGSCVNRSIKVTAFVEDPDRTDRVFLFLRLRDKENTLNVGEWSAGAEMIKLENGTFNYNIETHNLRRYFYYKNAWIEYQLVSVNEKLQILGRTRLFDRNISLVKCGF